MKLKLSSLFCVFVCFKVEQFPSFSMWFTASPPFLELNPEALVGTPVPQMIHQSRPPVSADRGHPQGTGTSVWNTQQDHGDPLRTRQSELDKALKVLEMFAETFWNIRGCVLEHRSCAQADIL